MPGEEVHISSLVVHAAPSRLQPVSDAIGALPGAQVHGSSANGKLVVTLEAGGADGMLSLVDSIRHLDGVLSAALVNQFADSLEAMNEEVPDAH
jgi:nitrate reductase NapD